MLLKVRGIAAKVPDAVFGQEIRVGPFSPSRTRFFHVGGAKALRQPAETPGPADVNDETTHYRPPLAI